MSTTTDAAPKDQVTPEWVMNTHQQQQKLNAELSNSVHAMQEQIKQLIALQTRQLSSQIATTVTPTTSVPSQPEETPNRHRLSKVKSYNGEDKTLYPQFRTKLEAKLRTDGRVIGSSTDQVFYAFGCLEGLAAARIHPWIQISKDNSSFTPTEFFAQLDLAFGDPRSVEKAVKKLASEKQGRKDFRTFLNLFDQTLLEANGFGWDENVKKGYLRNALSPDLLEKLVSVAEEPTYDLYCDQLRGIADRLEELQKVKEGKRYPHSTPARQQNTGYSAAMDWEPSPQSNRVRGDFVTKEVQTERRQSNLCIKCGKSGHYAKDCRTGWKLNDTNPASQKSKRTNKVAIEEKSVKHMSELDLDSDSDESGKE